SSGSSLVLLCSACSLQRPPGAIAISACPARRLDNVSLTHRTNPPDNASLAAVSIGVGARWSLPRGVRTRGGSARKPRLRRCRGIRALGRTPPYGSQQLGQAGRTDNGLVPLDFATATRCIMREKCSCLSQRAETRCQMVPPRCRKFHSSPTY